MQMGGGRPRSQHHKLTNQTKTRVGWSRLDYAILFRVEVEKAYVYSDSGRYTAGQLGNLYNYLAMLELRLRIMSSKYLSTFKRILTIIEVIVYHSRGLLSSGVRFQYFVLRFGFLKNRGFWCVFGFAKSNPGVSLVSVLSFNGTCGRLEVETWRL